MVNTKAKSSGLEPLAQSSQMAEHLVRVGRLKDLQKQRSWDDAELARQCGRKQQQLNSWWTSKRMIGEKLARRLEIALGLPAYYLDERQGPATPMSRGEAVQIPSVSVTKRSRPIPVLAWEQVSAMLAVHADALPKNTPHLDSFAVASPLSKFLVMNDDSMSPVFQQGDHVLFDPQEAPRAGDTVLVRLQTGEHLIRTFAPRSAHSFDAVPFNHSYLPLSSINDGATVVAVMVEHRRYRPARTV